MCQAKFKADDILFFFYYYFSVKIVLDILNESFADDLHEMLRFSFSEK